MHWRGTTVRSSYMVLTSVRAGLSPSEKHSLRNATMILLIGDIPGVRVAYHAIPN